MAAAVLVGGCRDGGTAQPDRLAPEPPPTEAAAGLDRWAEPTGDPLVEDMTRELLTGQAATAGRLALAEPQARCLSSTLVRRLGVETLARVGEQLGPGGPFDLTALDVDERQRFATAVLTCLDLRQVVSGQLQGIEGITPERLECVVSDLTRDGTIRGLVRASIVEGTDLRRQEDELADPMLQAFRACLPADEVARLAGDATGASGTGGR